MSGNFVEKNTESEYFPNSRKHIRHVHMNHNRNRLLRKGLASLQNVSHFHTMLKFQKIILKRVLIVEINS